MKRYDHIIERFTENADSISIVLLATLNCNFRCRHCMYECPDQRYAKYADNEVVDEALRKIHELEEIRMSADLVLCGGEPTMDLDEFGRILYRIMHSACPPNAVCVTTNGWWLHDEEDTARLLSVIEDNAGSAEFGVDGFYLLVSDDPYHTRPYYAENVSKAISEIQNNPMCMCRDGDYAVCTCCGTEYAPDEEGPCSQCNGDLDAKTEFIDLPEIEKWIIPRGWTRMDDSQVMVNGRGWNIGKKSFCCTPDSNEVGASLSFLPDGKLADLCCRGSRAEFGTVWDDSLELLILAEMFIADKEPTCYSCRDDAADWSAGERIMGHRKVARQLAEKIRKWRKENV